ncbi:MAG: DJ-1/PfpI family protein [Candidatus Obscuribacterales bacterium]|nr:DJ-1/PfpI family protein [Candidatus Obscuribacterales bacterium]
MIIDENVHLQIGSLIFDGIDQIDVTGPFEVLSRLPNSTCRLFGASMSTVCDMHGLKLTPDAILSDSPQLDVLHIPGGAGQESLMDNEEVLGWIRAQAAEAKIVFSVCTGALICGAAGLIKGRRATTIWSAIDLLPYFGAIIVNERVVRDGNWFFTAGVTAGIDGALAVAAALRGQEVAETIQLAIAYAPEPPFNSGTVETASPAVLSVAQMSVRELSASRLKTAERVAERLGIKTKS